MSEKNPLLLRFFSSRRLGWSILIGILVVLYLFYSGFDSRTLYSVDWTFLSVIFIVLAFVSIAFRCVAYAFRLRLMTNGRISFGRCLYIIILWEFGSAASPSSVGGTALGALLISKEGFTGGESTGVILVSILFDEIFLVTSVPILWLLLGNRALIPDFTHPYAQNLSQIEFQGFLLFFVIAYAFLFLYTLVLIYGLFFNPVGIKNLIFKIMSIGFLKPWRKPAINFGNDIALSAQTVRRKPWAFWARGYIYTILAWLGKFMVATLIILAIGGSPDHLVMIARQIEMFIVMTVSPTPGASGIAEMSFSTFLAEYVPLDAAMAFLWRLITFYPFLLLGAILLPIWLNKKLTKTQ